KRAVQARRDLIRKTSLRYRPVADMLGVKDRQHRFLGTGVESRTHHPAGHCLARNTDQEVLLYLPVVAIREPSCSTSDDVDQRDLIEPWHVVGPPGIAFDTEDALVS